MREDPDDDLVAAACRGDEAAWIALWRMLAPAVEGYLRAQGAREAEDLTAEVFLGVVTRMRRFRGDGRAFRSFVFTVAHHRLVDARRRDRRRPPPAPLDAEAALTGGDVEEDALAALGAQEVLTALRGLSPSQRDVLLLRVVGDLTVTQTARVLGKRVGAVKALQRRGLAALRASFSDGGRTPLDASSDDTA